MAMKKTAQERPIGIDLFAGAGGLSLGFEQAGFDVAACVEIDPIHAAVHKFNFPRCATLCRSVTDVSGAEIRTMAGIGDRAVDVVFGGAPCQGFSMIGKRALDDPRNQLVHHFVRLVVELKANYFVFENVRGLTVGKHRQFLQEIIDAFKEHGYDVLEPYRVLNAADYGVPQDRQRLFLIGCRKGLTLPAYPSAKPSATVWDAIGDIPNADTFEELLAGDSVKAKFKKGSLYSRRLRGLEADPDDFSYARKFDPTVLTSSARTVHTELSQQRFLATEHGKTEPVSRFLKLDPNGVCNTLRAGTDSARGAFTSPRPIHPFEPRVVTVREAARLHSYPDWFRFHATKWHGFREIGNSVPPLLGRAVASSVAQAMGYRPEKPTEVLGQGDGRVLKLEMSEAVSMFGLEESPIATRKRLEPAKPKASGKKSSKKKAAETTTAA
ncbi:DNA cytosine methyltransferase [Paraburkholderia bannensis]|uniref:DNA cytosine methyltransferase n=1 Tax=Paraburkholderia bannensis TaxID=765414 RepID=UPI002ABD43E6|nr:DNA cytosine methyltransferase [Paraburkholderia bannensis]